MNLKNYILRLASLLILTLSLSTVSAQGIVYKNQDVFIGQSQTFTQSGSFGTAIVKQPRLGSLTLLNDGVIYNPSNNSGAYLDSFTISYKYKVGGGPITTNYAHYAVRVDNIFMDLAPDFSFTNKNQDITVDVIANDNSRTKTGNNPVTLTSISLKNNCDAFIISDNGVEKIKFKPDANFTGLAYLNYVACDGIFGNCKTGTLTVQVNNVPQSTSTSAQVSTSKATPIAILTPKDGFVAANSANATIELIENNAFKYTPNSTFVGTDNIVFTNVALGLTHTVTVDVIAKAKTNQFAINDVVYTPKNQAVTFDVLKNDRVIQAQIPFFTEPKATQGSLNYVNGKFTFTPVANYSGIVTFSYNLKNVGGIPTNNPFDEWATVNIIVSDQMPGKQIYELKTPKNTPLVLNYNIPILGWNWQKIDDPTNGILAYNPGYTTFAVSGQASVSGNNLLIYTPTQDFTGQDQFEVLYCINGNCKNVKCYVTVEAVTPSLPQYCVGDCVWSGDANNDGIVDIVDLLPIGYCQGELGFGRPNANTSWYGQFSNNWQQPLMPGLNMKYMDTNGDGEIGQDDVNALDLNYYKTHNITPEKVKNYKQLPLSFQLLTPNPQIGDMVEVDVIMGTPNNPAVDMQGFTMDMTIDESVVNYNSFAMSWYADSWMTYNSPYLHLAKKHSGYQADFGFVRSGGSAASGFGKVAKMSFVIEDDVMGFRDEDGLMTANITMGGGKTMGSDGMMYDIEPQIIPIKINTKKNRTGFDANKVITYPNPANNEVNIYVNGGYELSSYQVYNLAGQQIKQGYASGKSTQINISELLNGVYFVKVITDGGVVTKKIVKQ